MDGIATASAPRPELFLLSANTQASLKRQVDAHLKYAAEHPSEIRNIAYTLATRREKLPHRAFILLRDAETTESPGLVKAPARTPGVVMVFSGQGAQWAGMGKELIQTNLRFRQDLVRMDEILQSFSKPPSWTIVGMLVHFFHYHRSFSYYY